MESYDLNGFMQLLKDLKAAPPRGNSTNPKIVSWWEFSEWGGENWHIPIGAVSAYFVMVWVLPLFISKPFKSRPVLFVWNSFLGLGSISGFLYYFYALSSFVLKNGFRALLCGDIYLTLEAHPDSIWVMFFFVWSKYFELGDTFWLIVGQKPVIFLHWYHHITVLLYTWLGMVQHSGMGHIFICVNTFVHGIMYTYYAATQSTTLKPYFSPIAPYITTIQLTQMVIGVVATIAGVVFAGQDSTCSISPAYSVAGSLMYFSYFLLFLQFYFRRFGKKKDKKKRS